MMATDNELKPCPFCGNLPEIDTDQRFRSVITGKFGRAVAIFCPTCEAHMSLCCEDVPGMSIEDITDCLTENWNMRYNAN